MPNFGNTLQKIIPIWHNYFTERKNSHVFTCTQSAEMTGESSNSRHTVIRISKFYPRNYEAFLHCKVNKEVQYTKICQ